MKCRLDPRTRIEALRLSTRAWRALRRAKITTLAELQTAFGPHFLRLRNIGLTTYREIETLLKHLEGSARDGAAGPAASSLSSEDPFRNPPQNALLAELRAMDLGPGTLIEDLPLSKRAQTTLRQARITTLAELPAGFGPHFLEWPNVGRTTYREIETLLRHFEGSVQVGAAGPAAASLSSEASSATSPLAVSPSQLTSPEFDPATRIEYLPLSTRALNALQRADITTLGQLLAFFGPHFRDLKNVGRRTYCEIKEFVDHLRGDAPLPPQDPLESFRCFLDSPPARDKDILCSRFGLLVRLCHKTPSVLLVPCLCGVREARGR
jgi:DNA-directed RNA polymerase alpha subunit